VADAARCVLEDVRASIVSGDGGGGVAVEAVAMSPGAAGGVSIDEISSMVLAKVRETLRPGLRSVINATGTILHTNMGRAVLSREAVKAASMAGASPVNVELDLGSGQRGLRDSHVEALIKRLTGAGACSVVNNNAAAVLIVLNTLAEGREVIISRGELIEIGGSFRLPDIIAKSGCVLREVGTTNRTHPLDYREAVTEKTALIFKVHKSNFRIEGFSAEVGLKELVAIGRDFGLPVVEDLGSGALVDLSEYGLPKEPVVGERLALGADIVTFSGDKLLGGPQAGLIVGSGPMVELINKNPLKRALRADKLILSALEATLRLYLNRDELARRLPTLRSMTRDVKTIGRSAALAASLLRERLGSGFSVTVEDAESVVGGGSMPGQNLPTKAVAITHAALSPERIYALFLRGDPPVIGRIKNDKFLLDMRTVERPADVAAGLESN
jgi:L-seryl-tRNA(Ser) seleniumtransferase